jgi:hypothetical protein
MRAKFYKTLLVAILCIVMLPLVASAGDLDGFVNNLSLEARADSDGFKYRLRTQFDVGGAKVEMVLSNVSDPADAYMVFRIGEVIGKTPEAVLDVYRANRTKGWGVIAKKLGIKPGSPEFHALKKRYSPGKTAKGKKGGKGKGRK